jgi:hypothetical protein
LIAERPLTLRLRAQTSGSRHVTDQA